MKPGDIVQKGTDRRHVIAANPGLSLVHGGGLGAGWELWGAINGSARELEAQGWRVVVAAPVKQVVCCATTGLDADWCECESCCP